MQMSHVNMILLEKSLDYLFFIGSEYLGGMVNLGKRGIQVSGNYSSCYQFDFIPTTT